jgi:hypothetical protein
MYFEITLFNVVTLMLMVATVLVAARRFSARADSNWPLTYYGVLLAYWRGYTYTLDTYWVLVLRFEFLGGAVEKLIRTLEILVFGYVIYCCVKLILRW